MPRLRLAAAGCFLFVLKEILIASLNDINYLNSKSAIRKAFQYLQILDIL